MSEMSEHKISKKSKYRGGFTTVELIVVIVLLMILASGLVFGIMKWVEWTNFKQQNEYARTIFVAAQNQLTEYSGSGQLEEKTADIRAKEGIDISTLKDGEGNAYDLDKVWPESVGEGKNPSDYRDKVCSIIATADDYQAYAAGTLDERSDAWLLYEMLKSYLYDMSILNATVCIEFTPNEGQVFAVLYSNRATGFEYEPDNDNKKGTVDISNRETSYRKARMVGYYGVDTLYRSTTTKAEKPSISGVRLNNEETLNLTYTLSNVKPALQELTYEIIIYDKETQRALMKLLLDGTKVKSYADLNATDNNAWVSCEITRYNYDSSGNSTEESMGNYSILAWVNAENTITVVFDGADTAANSTLYYEAYGDLMAQGTSKDSLVGPLATLKSTNSFRRFGISASNIYCTIKGSGANYKTTATKQSNTEHAYFGSQNKGSDEIEYTLKNARHLYNIRYLEDYDHNQRTTYEELNTAAKIIYALDEDIDWQTFVEGGNLFRGQNIVRLDSVEADGSSLKPESFASIKQLRTNNEFKSSGEKAHTISGLIMSDLANADARIYALDAGKNGRSTKKNDSSGIVAGSVGLFLVNSGTIENVTLDAVNVTGEKQVGAFCGTNTGNLEKLTVDNSDIEHPSKVEGTEYVGGITGYQKPGDTDIHLNKLTNRAEIAGTSYVGGITGSLTTENKDIDVSVTNCSNYGKLTVMLYDGVHADDAQYIGGIVGYVSTSKNGKKGNITIANCTSSPQYSDEEIERIIKDDALLDTYLRGTYVGGIVGYNIGGIINECNTKKESADKEGYIFGYRYVGGIVGYNAGTAGLGNSSDVEINGAAGKRAGINEIHVMGDSYVGGIVGSNAALQNNGNKVSDSDPKPTENYKVTNWENRGIVVARSDYAGGIAGFNAGSIMNCTCNVENSDAVKSIVKSSSLHGDFVGGLAGYNSGQIRADKNTNVVCYVAGENILGGIVGYNAPDAEVTDYGVAGGYVIGKGSFVGGFAGLNASEKLLDGMSIISNPNEVSGTFCVGGTLGANMAAVNGKEDGLTAYFKTDNFLGQLKARAFAGGFIGYNVLLAQNGNVSGNIKNDKILEQATEITGDFSDLLKNETDTREMLKKAVEIAENLTVDLKLQEDAKLLIAGSADSPAASHSKFGGLTADIYVGGVIGYNEADTKLHIENVTNLTPVVATASIVNDDEQDDRDDAEQFTYSYAGGIIGKVTEDVVLINCKNQDVGDVSSQGTYLGGLCEINEGKIIDCEVSSIGTNDKDYVGGIAGLNKEDGEISGTLFENRTVTGRDFVGGVAAENFGKITGTVLKKANVSARSYAGVIAGFSAQDAEITIEGSENQSGNTVNVAAAGENIGGLVGCNAGQLSVVDADGKIPVKQLYAVLDGYVTGGSNVGGIVGLNLSGSITSFVNNAVVIAENGNAGGIVGTSADAEVNSGNKKRSSISECKNYGNVTATRSGNAGGIIGSNAGTLLSCTNTGTIASPNGMCGGMAGINTGEIRKCEVYVADTNLIFVSKTFGGGICGHNKGKGAVIAECIVRGIELTNPADSSSDNSALGGITGKNDGMIQMCSVGIPGESDSTGFSLWSLLGGTDSNDAKVSLVSNWPKVNMGGITGINEGEIAGDKNNYCRVDAELSFIQTNQAYYGNMGGIAGSNLNRIAYCEFNGRIDGTANNPQLSPEYNPNTDQETNGSVIYGYGGIAGVNGDSGAKSVAVIENCKVNAAKITGLGDPNNITNIGGAAGVNGLGASISGITFGSEDRYQKEDYNVYVGAGGSKSAYAHAGGIAGLNIGSILDIYTQADGSGGYTFNPDVDQTKVIVEGYRGHIGGISGYNRRTGQINNVATGNQWTVTALENAQDNGCGGIIGYQAFDNTMSYCINRAGVSKVVNNSNGVGGIIGRMETAMSSGFTIKNCINYGTIHGTNRTGGMIGVWKYYGGTITDCINFGFIMNNGSEGAGGIVGCFYSLDVTPALIIRCENHGTIKSEYSGGIAGSTASDKKSIAQIRNCVNTGLIQAGNNSGGIIGGMEKGLDGSSFIESCINYGNGVDFGKTGEIIRSNDNIGGIVATNLTNVNISKCFGLASVNWPISSKGVNNSNYYLTQTDTGELLKYYTAANIETDVAPDAFFVRKIEAKANTGSLDNSKLLYKLVLGDTETPDDKYNDRAYFKSSNSTGPWTYTFTFNTAIELNGMDLIWNRDNDKNPRQVLFDVYYSKYMSDDINGGDWKLYKENVDSETGIKSQDKKEATSVLTGNGGIARRVKIVVRESKDNNGPINLCLIRAYFKGKVTLSNITYDDYDGHKGYLYKGEYRKYTENPLAHDANSYSGLNYEVLALLGQDETKGIGAGLNIRPYSNGFQLNFSSSILIGLPGFKYNPLTDMASDDVKTDDSLEVQGDTVNNLRYQIFLSDHKYFNTDANISGLDLQPPQITSYNDIGAATYRVDWNLVKNASFYEYTALYYNKAGEQIGERSDIVYDTSVNLPVSKINGVAVEKILFSVKAGAVTLVNNKPGTVTSLESTYEIKVAPVLPNPLYHFELDEASLEYKAYLDNYSEYMEFFQAERGNLELALNDIENLKVYIYVGSSDKPILINAVDGVSKTAYAGDMNNNNIIFSAYAECQAYTSSEKLLRESQAPAGTVFTSDDKLAIVSLDPNGADVGFMGTRLDALSYQLKIGAVKNKVVYMRSELMATITIDIKEDPRYALNGIPIIVATSQLRTSDTTAEAVKTSLSALPSDLFTNYKDLQVRSYPMMMSNNIVYTGHTVDLSAVKTDVNGIGINAETLTKLHVTENKGVALEGTDENQLINGGKLAPGFVIELASDGTYTLYYNALLAYNDTVVKNPYPSSGTMTNQVYYHYLPEDRNMADPPKISTNASADHYVDAETLEIDWDKEKFKDGAVYDYVITGHQSDGSSVQIAAGSFTSEHGKANHLSYNTASWNYKTVIITISHRGEVDKNGMTILFPSTASETCNFRTRFSQVTRPDVSLHKNQDGSVEKNSLLYDVTWKNIPEGERLPADSASELDSYLIKVRPSSEDGMTQSYENDEIYNDMLVRAKELYENKPGVDKEVINDSSIRYTWQGLGDGYTVNKVMLLTWDNDVRTITRYLTEAWSFIADETMRSADTLTRLLDLNDYGRGDRLAISIQAIARSGSSNYRNSIEGVIREVTLPERLGVPDVKLMYLQQEYHEDTFLTLDAFQAGLNLVFNLGEGSDELQGRYELAMAVYDSVTAADDMSKVENTGDDGEMQGCWNYGSIETVSTKVKPITMNGNLFEAGYVLKLNDAYAGKWLKIAMRSVSESNVSSQWSDEDETTDKTVNYVWLQITRVQLSVPELDQGTKVLYYNEDGRWDRNPESAGGSNQMDITQSSLSFNLVDNANQYQLQLIRTGTDDQSLGTIRYVDWIYLEKSAGGYDVFYMTSDPEYTGIPVAEHTCEINPAAVWLGTITDGAFALLPYETDVADSALTNAEIYTSSSYIQLNDDGKGFTLVLPDALAIGHYSDPADLVTSQVSVQAKSSEILRYEASRVRDWYRVDSSHTNVVTLENYGDAPTSTLQLKVSERSGIAYELYNDNNDNWMVYEVVISEGNTVLKQDYISTYGIGTPGASVATTALLSDEDFAAYQGKQISIRAAAIIGAEQNGLMVRGGLSQWSSVMDMGLLPQLTLSVPDVQIKDTTLNATRTQSDITGSTSVNVPAVIYEWEKDLKAGAYEVIINGESFIVDCGQDLTEGSRKIVDLTSVIEQPVTQNEITDTYSVTETESTQNLESQTSQETTTTEASPETKASESQTDSVQSGESHPEETSAADTAASLSPKNRTLSMMAVPNEIVDTAIVYTLSAEVTLTVTRDGDAIRFSLLMPQKTFKLDDVTYNFAKEGINYIEIIAIPGNGSYSSAGSSYIVP